MYPTSETVKSQWQGVRVYPRIDSTDLTHLQRFCEWRKQNKTIGLHKKEYIYAYTLNIFNVNH